MILDVVNYLKLSSSTTMQPSLYFYRKKEYHMITTAQASYKSYRNSTNWKVQCFREKKTTTQWWMLFSRRLKQRQPTENDYDNEETSIFRTENDFDN